MLDIVMLDIVMLDIVMLDIVMLDIVMLDIVMKNIVMLNCCYTEYVELLCAACCYAGSCNAEFVFWAQCYKTFLGLRIFVIS